MFNRKSLTTSLLGLTAFAITATIALPAPASAAKQSSVIAACNRTKGCGYVDTGNGTGYGCSPHACFQCANGKCHQTRTSDGGRLNYKPGEGVALNKLHTQDSTRTSDTLVHRGNTAPANYSALSSNHMRMGGRH